jgi:hypothetical protein
LPDDVVTPQDRAALATVIRSLAGLALDESAGLREADVNPVILTPTGAVAVDAKLVFSTKGR